MVDTGTGTVLWTRRPSLDIENSVHHLGCIPRTNRAHILAVFCSGGKASGASAEHGGGFFGHAPRCEARGRWIVSAVMLDDCGAISSSCCFRFSQHQLPSYGGTPRAHAVACETVLIRLHLGRCWAAEWRPDGDLGVAAYRWPGCVRIRTWLL